MNTKKSILAALFLLFAFLLSQSPLLVEVKASSISDRPRLLQSLTTKKFGDFSLLPHQFTIKNLYVVTYQFIPAGSITFAIKFNAGDQYFGLGLGTSMTGSDIWAFEIRNNQVVATDRYGAGDTTPPLDTSSGGQNNLKVLGYEVTPTFTIVKFTRALNTHDPHDQVIKPGPMNFIWATEPGSPVLTYHGGDRGSLRVNLVSDPASTPGIVVAAPVGAQQEEFLSEEEYVSMEEAAYSETEFNEFVESLNMDHELLIENAEPQSLL